MGGLDKITHAPRKCSCTGWQRRQQVQLGISCAILPDLSGNNMSAVQDSTAPTDGGSSSTSATLFTPEQQAWLETFISARRVGSQSGSSITPPSNTVLGATTSAGNVGELLK